MYIFEISDILAILYQNLPAPYIPTILILTPTFHSLLVILDLVVSS